MGCAVDKGIMSGKKQFDGTYDLAPKGSATRVEAARMIMVLDGDVLKITKAL